MTKFIYDGFTCIEGNDEEVVFSRNSGEIRIEHNRLFHKGLIPMKKYSFTLIETDKNIDIFRVKSFMNDKFNNLTIILSNADSHTVLEIKMPLDSYKNEDMENFSVGKAYTLEIE